MDYSLIGSQLDREVERIRNEEHCGRWDDTPTRVKSFSELKKEHEAKCKFNITYEDNETCWRCDIEECERSIHLPF